MNRNKRPNNNKNSNDEKKNTEAVVFKHGSHCKNFECSCLNSNDTNEFCAGTIVIKRKNTYVHKLNVKKVSSLCAKFPVWMNILLVKKSSKALDNSIMKRSLIGSQNRLTIGTIPA